MRSLASTPASGDAVGFAPPPPEVRAACEAALREHEAAEAEALRRRRIAESGIPPEFAGADISGCDAAVRAWADRAARGSSRWLLLVGENGRGKTWQACAALKELASSTTVRFATMQDILDECGPRTKAAVLDSYASVGALLIDDFGKEVHRDWTMPVIFQVIDRRRRSMRPTLLTTNMAPDVMRAHFTYLGDPTMADSILSRLGGADAHRVEGRDRRLGA